MPQLGSQDLNNNSPDVGLVSLHLALVLLTSTKVSEAVNWIPWIQFVCHPNTQHHVSISRTVPTLYNPSLRSSHIEELRSALKNIFRCVALALDCRSREVSLWFTKWTTWRPQRWPDRGKMASPMDVKRICRKWLASDGVCRRAFASNREGPLGMFCKHSHCISVRRAKSFARDSCSKLCSGLINLTWGFNYTRHDRCGSCSLIFFKKSNDLFPRNPFCAVLLKETSRVTNLVAIFQFFEKTRKQISVVNEGRID